MSTPKPHCKDAKKLAAAGLRDKARALLDLLANDPFQNPPPYEKLVGDLDGAYSRRINIRHRLVYQVFKKGKDRARVTHVDTLRIALHPVPTPEHPALVVLEKYRLLPDYLSALL